LWSLFRGQQVESANPWRATTLEMERVLSGRLPMILALSTRWCSWGLRISGRASPKFRPQHLAPEQVVKARYRGLEVHHAGHNLSSRKSELIVEDIGGGGGGKPPAGGDDGDGRDDDKRRRKQSPSPKRYPRQLRSLSSPS